MRFNKTVHHRVPGHAHTMKQGELLTSRLSARFWPLFDHEGEDEAAGRKKQQEWRATFNELKEAFAHGTPEEALTLATDVYEDEGLPEPIAAALEPIIVELKKTKPEIVSYIFEQLDKDFDVMIVEDGHDRVPPDPDNPTCTIVWRNGLWRWVEGTAQSVVDELTKSARALK